MGGGWWVGPRLVLLGSGFDNTRADTLRRTGRRCPVCGVARPRRGFLGVWYRSAGQRPACSRCLTGHAEAAAAVNSCPGPVCILGAPLKVLGSIGIFEKGRADDLEDFYSRRPDQAGERRWAVCLVEGIDEFVDWSVAADYKCGNRVCRECLDAAKRDPRCPGVSGGAAVRGGEAGAGRGRETGAA